MPPVLCLPALGSLIERARLDRGLSRVELVRAAGYRNVSKGCRWLNGIERGEEMFPPLQVLRRFGDVLQLSDDRLHAAMRADFEALDAVPQYELVERLVAAVYRRVPMPEGLDREGMLAFAIRWAQEHERGVCLSLSPVRRIYAEPSGRWTESLSLGGPSSALASALGL